ncbi:hypothetical protein BDF20DRAFT_813531 [Mycotypha africana]|uniref:uncharacterized protein n=1 Tax=Mycotypha africana TaxID=64632 RepID=UPI00230106B8|nr:uncharacterized protein BDF20DRAFT_813531 [Mycotypha africana]KAI8987522.1 hypothetical protein BDF20DRAFT_813531 [Mycotypha africana]
MTLNQPIDRYTLSLEQKSPQTPSLERPFRIRKSLRELMHKPKHYIRNSLRNASVKLPPLPAHDPHEEEFAYDVLYECERGLLQFDPNPWCDANMSFTPMDIKNYQLPDPTWEWVECH